LWTREGPVGYYAIDERLVHGRAEKGTIAAGAKGLARIWLVGKRMGVRAGRNLRIW